MKKYFIVFSVVYIFLFQHNALGQSQKRDFTNNDWKEMIDNYDGLFRNHKKTDGVVLNSQKLLNALSKYPGKKVAILFARYPRDYEVNGKKGRVTLVLYVQNEQDKTKDHFEDLGGEDLCPPPICDPNRQEL
jgi:hypothetical protein